MLTAAGAGESGACGLRKGAVTSLNDTRPSPTSTRGLAYTNRPRLVARALWSLLFFSSPRALRFIPARRAALQCTFPRAIFVGYSWT